MRQSAPLIDLDTPETFAKFFKAASEFAIFPHAERRVRAKAVGVKTRQDSRTWIATQARGYLQDLNWRHAGPTDHIGVAVSRAFRRFGICRVPLYVHTTLARDRFNFRTTVCRSGVELNR